MTGDIVRFLERLRSDPRVFNYHQAAAKQAIVLPLLQLLGWQTQNVEEVSPDFPVQKGKIDYRLRVGEANDVFLVVAGTREGLERHQNRLSSLLPQQYAGLVCLTNGIAWHFYLQDEGTNYSLRRFHSILVRDKPSDQAAAEFVNLLSRDSVGTGKALRCAESMLLQTQREGAIEIALRDAWNSIICEPDSLLVELLAERAERDSGVRPANERIERFLKERHEELKMWSGEPLPPVTEGRRVCDTASPSQEGITQEKLVREIVRALKKSCGRARKRDVEEIIYRRFANQFRQPYWQETVAHGVTRWRHYVAWAKERAKHAGLVKRPADSGKGVWELTEKGWNTEDLLA